MLSRRHLRIKVLHALYAFHQSKNNQLDSGERELLRSLDKLYELFIYQLSLIVEIVDFTRKRIEENKQKFFPTRDDLNPSTRFIDNKFYAVLSSNRDFQSYCDHYKINWADEQEMIRKLTVMIRECPEYKEYMDARLTSFNTDKEIFITIFKKIISQSEILQFYFEEKNIYWSDNFFVSSLLAIKVIKAWEPHWDETYKLPLIFGNNSGEDDREDKEFILNLFRKSILKSKEFEKLIDDKVQNWEMDRIAIIDIILIKMALVEITESPSIPIKVTLNEYIELAKLYSTPKSKVFINGVLDKLISDLREQNLIIKTGRGLMDV